MDLYPKDFFLSAPHVRRKLSHSPQPQPIPLATHTKNRKTTKMTPEHKTEVNTVGRRDGWMWRLLIWPLMVGSPSKPANKLEPFSIQHTLRATNEPVMPARYATGKRKHSAKLPYATNSNMSWARLGPGRENKKSHGPARASAKKQTKKTKTATVL